MVTYALLPAKATAASNQSSEVMVSLLSPSDSRDIRRGAHSGEHAMPPYSMDWLRLAWQFRLWQKTGFDTVSSWIALFLGDVCCGHPTLQLGSNERSLKDSTSSASTELSVNTPRTGDSEEIQAGYYIRFIYSFKMSLLIGNLLRGDRLYC